MQLGENSRFFDFCFWWIFSLKAMISSSVFFQFQSIIFLSLASLLLIDYVSGILFFFSYPFFSVSFRWFWSIFFCYCWLPLIIESNIIVCIESCFFCPEKIFLFFCSQKALTIVELWLLSLFQIFCCCAKYLFVNKNSIHYWVTDTNYKCN